MLARDATRPPPLQIAAQGFRLPDPREWRSSRLFDQLVYTLEDFLMGLLPDEVILPSVR
jgi:hypothetical protein